MSKEDKEEEKRINDELSKTDDLKDKDQNKKKKVIKGKGNKKNNVSFEDDLRRDENYELKEGDSYQIVVKEEIQKDVMIKDLVSDFHLENKRQPSLDELNEITNKVNSSLDNIVN